MFRRCRRGTAPFGIGALLLALGLVLGGCGGGSDSSESGTRRAEKDASSTTSTTAKKDPASAAFCAKYQELQAERAKLVGQKASAQANFEFVLRGLKDLEAVATDPVKDALRATITAYEQVGPSLAAVGYDASKLTPEQRAPRESSAVSDANDTLTTYANTNCPPTGTTTTGR